MTFIKCTAWLKCPNMFWGHYIYAIINVCIKNCCFKIQLLQLSALLIL